MKARNNERHGGEQKADWKTTQDYQRETILCCLIPAFDKEIISTGFPSYKKSKIIWDSVTWETISNIRKHEHQDKNCRVNKGMTEKEALVVAQKGAVPVSGKLLSIFLENPCKTMQSTIKEKWWRKRNTFLHKTAMRHKSGRAMKREYLGRLLWEMHVQ